MHKSSRSSVIYSIILIYSMLILLLISIVNGEWIPTHTFNQRESVKEAVLQRIATSIHLVPCVDNSYCNNHGNCTVYAFFSIVLIGL